MKPAIHPEMHKTAKTTCSTCGTVFAIPSTVKEQTVEICRMCHPVYTGKQQKDLRGGRIDRFKRRQEATRLRSPGASPSASGLRRDRSDGQAAEKKKLAV